MACRHGGMEARRLLRYKYSKIPPQSHKPRTLRELIRGVYNPKFEIFKNRIARKCAAF